MQLGLRAINLLKLHFISEGFLEQLSDLLAYRYKIN